MALPESPSSRGEQYLAKVAGQDVAVPDVILSRMEQYLAKMAGQDVAVPDESLSRIEQYLAYIAENGSGSSITVEPLTVTQNGTQTAPSGKAYSPVTVNVPPPSGRTNITILQNGTTTENVTNYSDARITVIVQPSTVYANGNNTMLSNPFSELDFDSLYSDISSRWVFGYLFFTFNEMPVQVELYARNNVIGGMAFKTDPAVVGVECEWDANGVVTLDALMSGQVQDMRAYASQIQCSVGLYGTTAPTPAT